MKLDDALKHIEKHVKQLEQLVYDFETIAIPRYEQDKKLLETMRAQHLKMLALKQRADKGEEIPHEEIKEAVPEVFR